MNTGLAAVIVAVAIVAVVAAIVVPVLRFRGRGVGWDPDRAPSTQPDRPGPPPA